MVGSKILQHYLSCPDGVSAYKESLNSAHRFAKKFDNSTHYLEPIAAQMVINKGIIAALKPKGGQSKDKTEESGLESDVDTDKDKNKRHKAVQGILESEFRVFSNSIDAALAHEICLHDPKGGQDGQITVAKVQQFQLHVLFATEQPICIIQTDLPA